MEREEFIAWLTERLYDLGYKTLTAIGNFDVKEIKKKGTKQILGYKVSGMPGRVSQLNGEYRYDPKNRCFKKQGVEISSR